MKRNPATLSLLILFVSMSISISTAAPAATQAIPQEGRNVSEEAALESRAHAALSTVSGTLKMPGLEHPVNVLRDRWGVAHIYAQNQHDLFFAQGFVAAQDRLFQMELWKRSGQGRLAEVLGPSASATRYQCTVA